MTPKKQLRYFTLKIKRYQYIDAYIIYINSLKIILYIYINRPKMNTRQKRTPSNILKQMTEEEYKAHRHQIIKQWRQKNKSKVYTYFYKYKYKLTSDEIKNLNYEQVKLYAKKKQIMEFPNYEYLLEIYNGFYKKN